jgi:ferrochelatase
MFDSVIVVSFGGPNKKEDVIPFLENVTRGRNVPKERLLEVAEHYYHFGGKSPINEQNLALIEKLKVELKSRNLNLPIYYGNRNWEPFIKDALLEMKNDGKTNALAFFTSMFSCYSGCRQYRENISDAISSVDPSLSVQKLRFGFNHPKFISAMKERINEVYTNGAKLIFTAHSIPMTMAKGSTYELQLNEASRLIADGREYVLCYQSRSGPPHIPWLEPDILDVLKLEKEKGTKSVVVVPVGFVSDHMEIMFDLDEQAKEKAKELGLGFARARTVGTHPLFVSMIADLIEERMGLRKERACIGELPPWHDVCPENCCSR